jgi:phage terminase large subunit-like protein
VYEKMKAIQKDPTIDPTTLAVVYECPEEMDWRTEEAFKIANPAISGPGEEGFRSEEEIQLMRQAALDGEGENGYRQYYLNQWSKTGQRTLVSLEAWDRCGNPDLEIDHLRGCPVWCGVDLSSTTDLSSVGCLIKAPDGKWVIMSFCWLAGSSISECERRDRLQYSKYIADGLLFFDEKPTIQIESILSFFRKFKPLFPQLKRVGFDPYLGSQLQPLDPYFELVPIAQQFKFLSPAIKFLKTKILEGNLQHDGNGLLRAMVENARVVEDGEGNLKLSKVKSASRIDGLISIVIAISAMITEEVSK